MNKVSNVPWWSMSPRKAESTPDTDYADMGTAFGLDASMSPKDGAETIELAEPRPPFDRLNGRSVI